MKVNNYNNLSAEQFCTFALGNEGDKSPDKVSTTSALIYFLTLPQRPTSETKCPEHSSPTERIEFPNREVEVRAPAGLLVSKRGYLNSHRASSEGTEIPAGEEKEEKGKEKKRKKEATLGGGQPLAHLHQGAHWKCIKLGSWGETSLH